jgi:hypothetical protein
MSSGTNFTGTGPDSVILQRAISTGIASPQVVQSIGVVSGVHRTSRLRPIRRVDIFAKIAFG